MKCIHAETLQDMQMQERREEEKGREERTRKRQTRGRGGLQGRADGIVDGAPPDPWTYHRTYTHTPRRARKLAQALGSRWTTVDLQSNLAPSG